MKVGFVPAAGSPVQGGADIEQRLAIYGTRLERWMASRGVRPMALARESGYSRQHIGRVRAGRMDPTRKCMAAIIGACRRLSLEQVKAADLFELDDDRISSSSSETPAR